MTEHSHENPTRAERGTLEIVSVDSVPPEHRRLAKSTQALRSAHLLASMGDADGAIDRAWHSSLALVDWRLDQHLLMPMPANYSSRIEIFDQLVLANTPHREHTRRNLRFLSLLASEAYVHGGRSIRDAVKAIQRAIAIRQPFVQAIRAVNESWIQ